MSSPIRFDYNTFYNYYTNRNNIQIDSTPPLVYYYDRYKLKSKQKQGSYINIRGKKFYIDILPMKGKMIHNGLLFSIVKLINGKYWDDHFHFGIENNFSKPSRNMNRIDIIYFHKTTQDVTNHEKHQRNCYFVPDQDIRNIELIDCIETTSSKISSNDKFPISTEDFQIIKDIIQKPFLHHFPPLSPKTGGKLSRKKNSRRKKFIYKRKTHRLNK